MIVKVIPAVVKTPPPTYNLEGLTEKEFSLIKTILGRCCMSTAHSIYDAARHIEVKRVELYAQLTNNEFCLFEKE